MYTILHLSDLHRSESEPVDNTSLIAALLADTERYLLESPPIPTPDAIVVSGDLVRGAAIDEVHWRSEIETQYGIAQSFLHDLCARFLDNDKSRLILVPGNHDVCWNTSRSAMEPVPEDEYPRNIYPALSAPNTTYRWSWKDRLLFRIANTETYRQRMDHYWDFVDSFYCGVDLPIPIDRFRGFQLFELCDRRISVAAFDSTFSNDCFAYSGALDPSAIGKCSIELRDRGHSYDLQIAVWHHAIHGPPTRSDFMDISQVHEMIGHGFQLGLHGHQHRAATSTTIVHLDPEQSMAVVSAGSLCAGAHELPRGVNRQYNVIVIHDNFSHARIHVREMVEGHQFTRKRNGEFANGVVTVSWHPKTDIAGRQIDVDTANTQGATISAEAALRAGRPDDALDALRAVDVSADPYPRALKVQAYVDKRDWNRLLKLIQDPATDEETIFLITALTELGEFERAESALSAAQQNIDPSILSQLRDRIETRRLLRQ